MDRDKLIELAREEAARCFADQNGPRARALRAGEWDHHPHVVAALRVHASKENSNAG